MSSSSSDEDGAGAEQESTREMAAIDMTVHPSDQQQAAEELEIIQEQPDQQPAQAGGDEKDEEDEMRNVVAKGAGPGGATAPLKLTQRDELAIARLTALGFSPSEAVQAYISSGRIFARRFLKVAANLNKVDAEVGGDEKDEEDEMRNVVAKGAGSGGATAPLKLTQRDELAIARLTALGFSPSDAVQAYISSGRIFARRFLKAAANCMNKID